MEKIEKYTTNIKQFFKYVFCTPIKTKKSDWKDYTDLKQSITRAERTVDAFYKEIKQYTVYPYDGDPCVLIDRCLFNELANDRRSLKYKYNYYACVSQELNQYDTAKQKFTPGAETVCWQFKKDSVCQNKTCWLNMRNKHYIEAKQKYESLQAEYRNFWANKIANTR